MTILVMTTGGTINAVAFTDPVHAPPVVTMPPDQTNRVQKVLETFSFVKVRIHPLKPVDSKEMNDAYRSDMLNIIEGASEKAVLITQGTDTLLQTADYFYHHSLTNNILQNKIILITGAMMPLGNGSNSDGYLNLEFSARQLMNMSNQSPQHIVFIVLCDYQETSTNAIEWYPKLYPYEPGVYEKFYDSDSRYNRLIRI